MDTMSPTVRQHTAENRNEQRFLADQAADAKVAMLQTMQEMKHALAKAADVRTCARQHPWIATGSVLAAGFVAGAVLSRHRATAGQRRAASTETGVAPDHAGHDPAQAKAGFLRATLGTIVAGLVQTLLQGFIAGAVVGTEVEPVHEELRFSLPPRPESEPQMDTNAHACP